MKQLQILILSTLLLSCNANNKSADSTDALVTTSVNTTNNSSTNLAIIKQDFKRINSIVQWDRIDSAELRVSLEGGQAKYYYKNEVLEKVTTHLCGEMWQALEEYYFLNNELSFVFEKQYRYNRPMYYDSTRMKENDDTEVFDFDQSEIIERRNYFASGKLIHHINSDEDAVPFVQDYLMQVERYTLEMVDTLMAYKKTYITN